MTHNSPQSATEEVATNLGLQHMHLFSAVKEAPLFILVHGRGGDFNLMWTFKRVLPTIEPINIISPQAHLKENDSQIGGYSWWQVGPRDDYQRAISEAAITLERFIEAAIQFYQLKPRYIVGLGFSQGGGLLSILVQRDPHLFYKVAILAGFVPDIDIVFSKVDSPTQLLWLHGSDDQIIPVHRAQKGADYLNGIGIPTRLELEGVGHKIGSNGMRTLKEWLR